ncbi:MAG TPA: NAD(P)H-dependent oxidoreductase [Thermoanaerobaculia bacterium]|nr:NAD(P)H-dependent oxidoreductase [Thermoanaerobaculia bacterium]
MALVSAVKVVGLGGSLAKDSTSLAALKVALEGAEKAGAGVELFDLRVVDFPMYSPEVTPPDNVRSFCDSVASCGGMLWSSPLYNGTISGLFKNALDWLHLLGDCKPAYLTDKVIGMISTAGGTQGLQAVNTMEFIVRALRGWAVPLVIPIPQAWRTIQKGQVLNEATAEQLRALGAEVARAAKSFAAAPITTPEAARAEAAVQPASEAEARRK